MCGSFSRRHLLFAASIVAASTIVTSCQGHTPAFSSGPTQSVIAGHHNGESGKHSRQNFHFVTVSKAPNGDLVVLAGDGTFGSSEVEGRGIFTHFTPVGSPPFPIVAAGSWEANRVVSFSPVGTYGTITAGILVMSITLHTDSQEIPATLTVICNVGPGGLQTGEEGGTKLEVSGTTFTQFNGLTAFSNADREED